MRDYDDRLTDLRTDEYANLISELTGAELATLTGADENALWDEADERAREALSERAQQSWLTTTL